MADFELSGKELIASKIDDVKDFPEPGVVFKDITPLLACPKAFQTTVDELVAMAPAGVDMVVGLEARGFIFAAPVALALGVGFVPIRKPGKLPKDTFSESFQLEYGTSTLTVHQDAIPAGAKVMVIDDVLATGGTVGATASLLTKLGAELVHVAVVMELGFLNGRQMLAQKGITDHVSAILTV